LYDVDSFSVSLEIVQQEYESIRSDLETIAEVLDKLESDADAIGVTWTPGRNIR
jgi:hypothetical protein